MMRFRRLALFLIVSITATALADHTITASRTGSSDYQMTHLHYENASGEKGVTLFYYDGNGIMHRSFWTLLDSSRYGWSWHTYDSDGNMVLKYREFSDSLTSENRFTWDDSGQLIKDEYHRSDGPAGQVFYTYDDQNRCIGADCQKMNGWFEGQIQYEYDALNRKTRGVIRRDDQPMGTISYEYDDRGLLVREHWDFGGRWSQTFRMEYRASAGHLKPAYPSSNVFIRNTGAWRVKKENYDYSGKSGGPSFFYYDQAGKLKKKIFESSAGFKTVTDFEYSDNGLLKASHRHYSDGKEGTFTYEFDGNRRLVRRVFERSDGLTGLEVYEYNAKGELIRGRYEKFDSWLTGDLNFESDENGYLTSGTFTGERFNADIDFNTDAAGNVIRVQWNFSYEEGATQTYEFEYEAMGE